jgi:hypothetical protein
MQSRNRLLIFLSVTLVFCSGLYGQDEDNWTYRNWPRLKGIIMPIKPFEAGEFPKLVRWMVTIRITGPNIDPIVTLMLQNTKSGIEATVMRPIGSMHRQIGQLTKSKPDASVEEVASGIKLVHATFDARKCPALVKLSKEFEHLSVSAVLPAELIVDSTEYNILSQSAWGNSIQVIIAGPGPGAPVQQPPIVDWVERFRKLADRECK